jgi:hypothetical protein
MSRIIPEWMLEYYNHPGDIPYPFPENIKQKFLKMRKEAERRDVVARDKKLSAEEVEKEINIEEYRARISDVLRSIWIEERLSLERGDNLSINFVYCEVCGCEAEYIVTDNEYNEHLYCKNHVSSIHEDECFNVEKISNGAGVYDE